MKQAEWEWILRRGANQDKKKMWNHELEAVVWNTRREEGNWQEGLRKICNDTMAGHESNQSIMKCHDETSGYIAQ